MHCGQEWSLQQELGPHASSSCPVLGVGGRVGSTSKHRTPDLSLASEHAHTVADPSFSPGEAEKSSAALTRGNPCPRA